MDEGYIKYNCHWEKATVHYNAQMEDINRCRSLLYQEGWIGMYANGIGYGNISIRSTPHFMITGSATGGYATLTSDHFSTVTGYDLIKNEVSCYGPIKASSESLTHAAIYETDPEVNAVMHIHNKAMWQMLLHKVPTTVAEVPYGTPDMAEEIKRLFRETNVAAQKIIAMAGHEEGIIAFGATLNEALNILFLHKK